MPATRELSSTLEDYLETIYRIEKKKKAARPRDISRAQNVASSTVTAALQSLAHKGLINYEPYEVVTLTEKGRRRADEFFVRHSIIEDFLENILGLESERASAAACQMEHALDRQVLERFICFLAFTRYHSPDGARWLEGFRDFVEEGMSGRSCKHWTKEYLKQLRKQHKAEPVGIRSRKSEV